MTPDEVRLHDLKAKKGHLCQGGAYTAGVPVCGCGLDLRGVPDFLTPLKEDVDAGRVPTAVLLAEALDVPVDAITPGADVNHWSAHQPLTPPPPWAHRDEPPDDPMAVADQLEATGRGIIDAHDGVDMNPALPLLDPTAPFGPAEIEARIIEANDRLERGAMHEANLVAAAEKLGVDYALAYARALSEADGSAADIRKAQATLATERLFRQWKDAVAAMKAMQSVMHTLRSTLSGYQSVGRSVGAAYQGPGRDR